MKSGNGIGRLPLATDRSVNSHTALSAAASYTFMSVGRPSRRHVRNPQRSRVPWCYRDLDIPPSALRAFRHQLPVFLALPTSLRAYSSRATLRPSPEQPVI